jgi:hypothetical protein
MKFITNLFKKKTPTPTPTPVEHSCFAKGIYVSLTEHMDKWDLEYSFTSYPNIKTKIGVEMFIISMLSVDTLYVFPGEYKKFISEDDEKLIMKGYNICVAEKEKQRRLPIISAFEKLVC